MVNISGTALSGPLPLSLIVPPDPNTTSPAPASRLTVDISGLDGTASAPASLCSPFNLTKPLEPLPHNIVSNGQPALLPVCEGYVSWQITLPASAACALAELCSPGAPPPTLAQRAGRASISNSTIAQLACAATCASPGNNSLGDAEEAHFANVGPLRQPRYNLATAHPASGIGLRQPLTARRLRAAPSTVAARRLLSHRPLPGALPSRQLLQAAPGAQEADAGEANPTIELATLGLPATPATARDLLSALFSDVLTPQQIEGAVATTGNSSSFEVAPVAVAPAPVAVPPAAAPAPTPAAAGGNVKGNSAGVRGVNSSRGPDVAGAPEAETGGVTAVDASESAGEEDDSLPAPLIAILVVTACVVMMVVGFAVWRSQGCTCDSDLFSVTSSKPADYLAARAGSSGSRPPSDSRYGDLEPESEEDRMGYPQLSASMSFSNLREVVSDVPGGVRRPLWMAMDRSGSLRNILGGRSNSFVRGASGGDSRSPAGASGSGGTGTASGSHRLPSSSASARSHEKGRFFAEFGKGSPAKSLLHSNGSASLLPSPRRTRKSSSLRSTVSNEYSSSGKVRWAQRQRDTSLTSTFC